MNFPIDITWYLKRYDNFFDDAFCQSITEQLEKIDWTKHQYFTYDDTYVSHDDDLQISYQSIPQTEILHHCVETLIQKYLLHDLPPDFTWFKTYKAFANIRYNRYDIHTQMRPHCDHIHDLFDGVNKGVPILTVLGSLNNNYRGGDLIMWGNQKIEFPAGTVLIFPSNFLYPHCITKILEGTRFSFVTWVW